MKAFRVWIGKRKLSLGAAGLLVCGGLLCPLRIRAQFGIPEIVFDPTSYGTLGEIWSSNLTIIAKLIAEYNQLVLIYTNAYQWYQFEQSLRINLAHGMRLSWGMQWMPLINDYTQNQYGETILWPSVLSGAPANTAAAWASATMPVTGLQNGGWPSPMGDPRIFSALQAKAATLEITDGGAVNCLQTLSQYRQNDPLDSAAIQNLLAVQQDDSDLPNTTASQATTLNGASGQNIAELRNHGKLDGCLVEQAVLANKAQRDEIAADLNYAAHLQSVLSANTVGWDGNVQQAIASFQLP